MNKHLLPAAAITFDRVNYLPAGQSYPGLPKDYASPADYVQALRAMTKPGTAFFKLVNDYNANLAYVRVRSRSGKEIALTIVVNRWHDNVKFLMNEDAKLDPSKDSADFLHGLIGSYPNYFVDIKAEDLTDFFDLLVHFEKSPEDYERLAKYGINRADDRFWDAYDWFGPRTL